MRTKTLCTSCEQYVYTDADHSCHDAKALRAVRDAEAAVVEAAEKWRTLEQAYDAMESGAITVTQAERDARFRADIALNELRVSVRALHAARGQSPQDAEGITRQGEAS